MVLKKSLIKQTSLSIEFILKAPGGLLIEHEATVYIVTEYILILWFILLSLLLLFKQRYLHFIYLATVRSSTDQ